MEPPLPIDFFESDSHKLAITGSFEEIYPHLQFHGKTHRLETSDGDNLCSEISIPDRAQPQVTGRPQELPLYPQDLRDFCTALAGRKGKHSVPWKTTSFGNMDTLYTDGFRTVVSYRTAEFMIRPLDAGDKGPSRLQ